MSLRVSSRLQPVVFRTVATGCLLLVVCHSRGSSAQEMQHDQMGHAGQVPAKAVATSLAIGYGEKTLTLDPAALRAMPHQTITVHNGHSNAEESYSGVLLSDLLTQVGAPLGAKLHGKVLASYVLATGSDGYGAIYSIAEIDPAFHSGSVIVADTLNQQPLREDGPWKLVNTEDKHPARWVRNLAAIKLIAP